MLKNKKESTQNNLFFYLFLRTYWTIFVYKNLYSIDSLIIIHIVVINLPQFFKISLLEYNIYRNSIEIKIIYHWESVKKHGKSSDINVWYYFYFIPAIMYFIIQNWFISLHNLVFPNANLKENINQELFTRTLIFENWVLIRLVQIKFFPYQ